MILYLISTFEYNLGANIKLLQKIGQLPEPSECIRLVSHLINCQHKWIERVKGNPDQTKMDWWLPVYPFEELESRWKISIDIWLEYLRSKTEAEIDTEVQFIGFDGSLFAAAPKDIALQLNYHSIHHRAQMQTIIRSQGLEPDFLDYIGTRYRRVDTSENNVVTK